MLTTEGETLRIIGASDGIGATERSRLSVLLSAGLSLGCAAAAVLPLQGASRAPSSNKVRVEAMVNRRMGIPPSKEKGIYGLGTGFQGDKL